LETIELLTQLTGRTDAVMQACRKIQEGIADLAKAMSQMPLEKLPTRNGRDLAVLTKRHREIFALIAQDVAVEEMAKRLKLSARTVDSHRDTIRKRLNFGTVSELTQFARQHANGG
jgi:DNA-binding NarL/FixJ family response regulator